LLECGLHLCGLWQGCVLTDRHETAACFCAGALLLCTVGLRACDSASVGGQQSALQAVLRRWGTVCVFLVKRRRVWGFAQGFRPQTHALSSLYDSPSPSLAAFCPCRLAGRPWLQHVPVRLVCLSAQQAPPWLLCAHHFVATSVRIAGVWFLVCAFYFASLYLCLLLWSSRTCKQVCPLV
jgi:hypothetical protein